MENDIYKFSFKDCRLLSVHFELKTDKEYKLAKDIEISANLNLRHDCLKDKKHLRLYMKVDICGEQLPFSIDAEMGGLFLFSKEIKNKSLLDKIARINCAAIVFPFLREILADITRRANLPPIKLPPVNFIEIYNAQPKPKKKQMKPSK